MKINFNKKRLLAFLLGGVMFVVCRGVVNSSKATQEQDTPLKIVSEDIDNEVENVNNNDSSNETFVNIENLLTSEQFGNLKFLGNVNLFVSPGDLEAMVNINLRRGNDMGYENIGKICGGDVY